MSLSLHPKNNDPHSQNSPKEVAISPKAV